MRRSSSRFVLALIAAGSAAALLAGCSPSTETPADSSLPDAPGLLQQSAETTRAATSAHLDISVVGEIPQLPVKTVVGDLTNVPSTAFKGSADLSSMGGVKPELVVIDGTLYGALSGDNWMDFGPAADIYDPSTILNPDTGLANLLVNITEANSTAAENVNGIDTVKVTGTVNAETVNKLIAPLAATESMPVTVWVENGGSHSLVKVQLAPAEGTSIDVALSKWNEPVSVTNPMPTN